MFVHVRHDQAICDGKHVQSSHLSGFDLLGQRESKLEQYLGEKSFGAGVIVSRVGQLGEQIDEALFREPRVGPPLLEVCIDEPVRTETNIERVSPA